ncbi:MAG: DUF5063 domain-containing protein [Candidatus Thiodiazotropha endolucinida]
MDIEETIKEFLDFVLKEDAAVDDLGELMAALDKLAYSVNNVKYEFDETEYPEAPERDYQLIREKAQKRFPDLGFYNMHQEITEKVKQGEIIVGDALDDISDIVGDLRDVLWCFENTSKNDALWHYQNSFRSHWGRHLRELQLYLHDKWW